MFYYTAIRVVLLQIFGVDVFLDCLELMLLRSVLLCVCVCVCGFDSSSIFESSSSVVDGRTGGD